MKKIISQILLLSLLTVIFSCNNYGTYIMPTFRPLDNTADIVFIENTRWLAQETEIIAINTKTSKAEHEEVEMIKKLQPTPQLHQNISDELEKMN
ncbi:MAG: hypothetical protein J6Y01_09700, partial [Spirochaetales bacterium]|nr:hypothetical protein [Spirochaetales bacterium]